MRSVARINTGSQPTNPYISSSSAGPGTASALPRQPYDSRDQSERADHELWLLFVNRFDIAFRSSHEGPRDGAHCPAVVQPLSLTGCLEALRASRAVGRWGSLCPSGGSYGAWHAVRTPGQPLCNSNIIQDTLRCVNGSAMARVAQQNLSKLGSLVIPRTTSEEGEKSRSGAKHRVQKRQTPWRHQWSLDERRGCSTCIDDSERKTAAKPSCNTTRPTHRHRLVASAASAQVLA